MASIIDYRGLVTITTPDPSGDGGLLCQNNFRSLTDSILVVSGLISLDETQTQLSNVSGYLDQRDISISGYNTSVYGTIANITSLSGYFQRRDTDISGYVIGLGIASFNSIINASNTSGYLQNRDTDISGYFAAQLAGGAVTQNQLNSLSGYLQIRDTDISGYLSSSNTSIISNVTSISGYLDTRNISISGYLQQRDLDLNTAVLNISSATYNTIANAVSISGYFSSQIGGGSVTQTQLSNVSGYLQQHIIDANTTASILNASTYGTITNNTNVSGYLQKRDTDISGYLVTLGTNSFDTISNAANVSGYFASQLGGGGVTQGQLSNLSGYLNGRDSTLSGYTTTFNSSTYGTITNDTNVSGYLQKRDTDISGYLVSIKESLSNKNISGGYLGLDSSYRAVVSGIAEPFLNIGYTGTVTLDMSTGSFFKTNQTGNLLIQNPSNAIDGQVLIYKLKQAQGSSGVLSLGTKFLTGPFTVANSATSGKVDFLAAKYDSADDKFYVLGFAPGY